MKVVPFTVSSATSILVLMPIFAISSANKHESQEVQSNHKLLFQIKVHGFFLWASMGFLIPIGLLIIRISNREKSGRRLRILFYAHATLQILAELLTTAGAVMSIIHFDNSFENAHQRIGLTLYGAVWLQTLTGVLRSKRGSKSRSVWYVGHWAFGTTVSVLGIINVYTGLNAYHKRTSKSISLWTVLFSIQISIIVFLYLFQDKWAYIRKQGMVFGNESVQPTDQKLSPREAQRTTWNLLLNIKIPTSFSFHV